MAGKHTCVLSECHSTRVPKKVAENAERKKVTASGFQNEGNHQIETKSLGPFAHL